MEGNPNHDLGDVSGPASGSAPGSASGSAAGSDRSGGETFAHTVAATGRGVGRAARASGRSARYVFRQARRASHAEGAGSSGLSRLIEMHAFGAAGDAAVAVGLAGTLFFQVPTDQARGQVALFLALTMLPFAIVAPLIGPFLDRFSHGRRWAIGATMAVRAVMCLLLASAIQTESTWMFPWALGVLVASKAYAVTKAAAVPRLRPEGFTLVKANGRVSVAGVIGVGVSAPLAALFAQFGADWALRYAFVVFAIATILAILLPAKVDANEGETSMALRTGGHPRATAPGAGPVLIPPAVAFALKANCGPRWFSGFLTMFMAFLLRENPIGDWKPELLLGLVIAGVGIGNTAGIALAAMVRKLSPGVTVIGALIADVLVAFVAAWFYGVPPLLLIGLAVGLSGTLAKISLDSTIQRDVHPRVQASAFARSDTTLQLAWVLGGFMGIVMPLHPRLGLGVACGVMAAWTVYVLVSRRAYVHKVTQAT